MADRSQKNRKTTRGAEKHAPEAVFDGISRLGLLSGYTVKDRMRSAWGSTKSGSSLIKPEDARVTYCILSEQTRIPKIQLRGGGVPAISAMSASTGHGANGCVPPLSRFWLPVPIELQT
jgi:hypothetical protein